MRGGEGNPSYFWFGLPVLVSQTSLENIVTRFDSAVVHSLILMETKSRLPPDAADDSFIGSPFLRSSLRSKRTIRVSLQVSVNVSAAARRKDIHSNGVTNWGNGGSSAAFQVL